MVENFNGINFNGRTDKECKVIKRLVLDFRIFEKDLKYFNAEELVNAFIVSDFYSANVHYNTLYKRCKAFMIDEYPNC